MNALAAMWGGFLNDAKSAVGEVAARAASAATSAAAASAQQLQTEAGRDIQATGIGVGASVAGPGTSPQFVAWIAANWELLALAVAAWFLLRRPR